MKPMRGFFKKKVEGEKSSGKYHLNSELKIGTVRKVENYQDSNMGETKDANYFLSPLIYNKLVLMY